MTLSLMAVIGIVSGIMVSTSMNDFLRNCESSDGKDVIDAYVFVRKMKTQNCARHDTPSLFAR